MLMKIRAYLEDRGSASLADLANRFGLPPEAVEGMVGHWVRKGRVRRVDLSSICPSCSCGGGCSGCAATAGSGASCCGGGLIGPAFAIYEWVDRPSAEKTLGSGDRAA